MLSSLLVYLDGAEEPFIRLDEEEIRHMLEESPTFQFDLKGGGREKRSVRIVASDRAGNSAEDLAEDFTLTSNVFVRLFNNRRLFYGLLGGFAAASSGATVLLVLMRRRRKKGEKASG